MSERKVINKYYPPDYDPSKVPRIKRKNKLNDVRMMAPFNMRCNTCGDYIGVATKFNAKKETVEDETYKTLLIFRFYIKCKRCMATIVLRTNPKEKSYEVEKGATENFKALKLAEKQAREEAEAEQEEEKIDPMKQLENRTKASRQQMEASEQIRNLRTIKHRFHKVDIDSLIEEKRQELREEAESRTKSDATEDDEAIHAEALRLLKRKAITSSKSFVASTSNSEIVPLEPPTKRLSTATGRDVKKISSSLSELKKKLKPKPKQ